jgi:type I restriction enzyme, S subunit
VIAAQTLPLRRVLLAVKTGTTPPAEQLAWLSDGPIPWYSPGDIQESLKLAPPSRTFKAEAVTDGWVPRFPAGSTLLVGIGNVGRLAFLDHDASGNQQITCLVPGPLMIPRFLAWQLYARQSELLATAPFTILPILNNEFVRSLLITVPPLTTQRAIADYLDRETARIDALIAAKRRMVELLEDRLAIYTRQLLTSVEHKLQPLKRTWRVVDCKHRTPKYVDKGYPVISPGDTTPGRLDVSRAHRFVDEKDYQDLTEEGRQPRRGDIVYSRNASIGIAAFVDTDVPFCMGQDVCLVSSDRASQLFLTYFLNSLGLDQLEEQKVGSTFSRANVEQILELIVPTPEPEDQHRIAEQLDERTNSQQKVVSLLDSQINLLQERRQALITAAVTGQLDVPEAA